MRTQTLHHTVRELAERLAWMRYELNETTDQLRRVIELLDRPS